MDLDLRTHDALDWAVLRGALAAQAMTERGAVVCAQATPLADRAAVLRSLDGVDEILAVREAARDVPLGDVADIAPSSRRAEKGEVLDLAELRRVGRTLAGLQRLASTVLGWPESLPVLQGEAGRIALDPGLVDTLREGFDEQGRLSARLWPELGELRERIAALHTAVRRVLDEMLRDEGLADVLQDAYVTQRRDRYVLPIKARAKHMDLGIVHDVSGSGQTVYVEPAQVVALNNQLRVAEAELESAAARIRATLSRWIGAEQAPITEALNAATDIDGLAARAGLAEQLGATRPTVGADGVIHLMGARHPVLALRGVAVVPNDLAVDARKPALMLSGPNAGGKTVALKTIGLCALLVRIGAFVPAEAGSRVDHFGSVYADIGDAQSIQGDLSSFSGHLVVLRELLARAAPGHLVLLDEIATGTDPSQGAALARAVLEALLDRGVRAVVTTHYAQLKSLATSDPRFAVAAMEYAGDQPTYRVVGGVTGESHAFGIAARLGLDPAVLDRARALMGDTERAFTEALEAHVRPGAGPPAAARRASYVPRAAAERLRDLARRAATLKERAKALEQQGAAAFLERLERAERAVAAVVADLQRAPSHAGVGRARAALGALRAVVPDAPAEAPAPAQAFAVGDRVRLRRLGQQGEVVNVGDEIAVRVGAMTVRARPDDLERAGGKVARPRPVVQVVEAEAPHGELADALRLPGNTCDLRGMRVDDALVAADKFLDDAKRDRQRVVFFLHGHGTGAIKQALREWLPDSPYVRDLCPATALQGGDAYTVASLR